MENKNIWLSWTEIDRNKKPCNEWGSYFPSIAKAFEEAENLKRCIYVSKIVVVDEINKSVLFTYIKDVLKTA